MEIYNDEPVERIIHDSLEYGNSTDTLVFLMGPYRLLDPSYLYTSGDFSLPPDPLEPNRSETDPDRIEKTLGTIAKRITAETQVRAFTASDVAIPTRTEVDRNNRSEPGMPVIDQSVAFAKASAGNAFLFTQAGLTTGVGAEAGAIPEYFGLRSSDSQSRDPRTLCIFSETDETDDDRNRYEPKFSSASINEMDDAYDIRFRYFVNREDLVETLITFVESYVVPSTQ